MSGLGRAIAVLSAVSVIGTATQVAKGKLGAIFLGAADIGVLSQLTLLYNVLFIVAGFGFFHGMMRQISLAVKDGDTSQARAQMNSVALFLGVASVSLTGLCLAHASFISNLLFSDNGEREGLVALIVLAVPIAVQQRIFRAYLNATRDLKGISRAQVSADVLSVVVFAIGAWQFGIWGGAVAFVVMHSLLLFGMLFFSVRTGGIGLAFPDPRRFSWRQIVPNFGYGVNGLIMTAVAGVSVISIGRMIALEYNLAQLGIFSVAWKVATVYLGALYSAAGSYYFPTLVRMETSGDLEVEANNAIALYMTILPPLMAGLLVFGDPLMTILFSAEFVPAVLVMAGLLVGDLFRVTGETIGLTLLARRHLVPYSGVYILYASGFVGLSWLLLPSHGLFGVAISYVVMQLVSLVLVLLACRSSLGVRLTKKGARALSLAVFAIFPLAVAEVVGASTLLKFALATLIGAIWFLATWHTTEMTNLRVQALKRLKK